MRGNSIPEVQWEKLENVFLVQNKRPSATFEKSFGGEGSDQGAELNNNRNDKARKLQSLKADKFITR